MKKIMLLMILLSVVMFTQNVNATSTSKKENENGYTTLYAEYNKGTQPINVTGTEKITLYGYSECSSSGCDYTYSKTSSDIKEVLKKTVRCTNGEKYINYQTMQNSSIDYKSGIDGNGQRVIGRIAWSEEVQVTCTSNSTGSIELSNTSVQQTTKPITSADSTHPEDNGVETYYIILGIVALITYLLTIVIKKQNLFKKV